MDKKDLQKLRGKDLSEISVEELGADKNQAKMLKAHGVNNAKQVLESDKDFLTDIDGVGDKTADSLKEKANETVEDDDQEEIQNVKTVAMAEPSESQEVSGGESEAQALAEAEGQNVQALIERAIDTGAGIETLERLFDLQKKVKGERSQSAYIQAKAQFQQNCPAIPKKKEVKNNSGQVIYKYAPLEDIVSTIKAPLAQAGLSFSWDVENKEANGNGKPMIKVECTVTHQQGHSESSTFTVPVDVGSNKLLSSPQEYAKSLTYAKRYTLTNILGISTEEDTDAVANDNRNAKSPKSKIVMLLKKLDKHSQKTEELRENVKELTDLELKEDNFQEIIGRLEMKVEEMEHDTSGANRE